MEKTGVIQHYIPNFVDIDGQPERANYNSLEELLAVDFVHRMKHDFTENEHFIRKFHQFSVAWSDRAIPALMVEYNEGKEFYVIGFLYDNLEIPKQLPVWKYPKP